MLTSEDLKLLSDMLDKKLEPINERLDEMEDSIEEIKENSEITRTALNEVIQWIDVYFRDEYPFPVDKVIWI